MNDNLKRKRIYLERENFNLMSVLRKSLEATEGLNLPKATPTGTTTKPKTRTATSDLNSLCPSTTGTKSGVDQVATQSIKGSTAAQPYGDENAASFENLKSRKQTRMLSAQDVSTIANHLQQINFIRKSVRNIFEPFLS